MYRKYILDQVEEPQPQASSTFPDTHLIVGEAQSKAARAGAAHRRDSGARVPDSGTYRSEISDSRDHLPEAVSYRSEKSDPTIHRPESVTYRNERSDSGTLVPGSVTHRSEKSDLRTHIPESGTYRSDRSDSGIESELGGSYSKASIAQSEADYKVESKSQRDWGPYKKPSRVKSETDILRSKPAKKKSDSGVQCDLTPTRELQVPLGEYRSDSRRTSSRSESDASSYISNAAQSQLVSQAEVRPQRQSPYSHADVDLFDDFVLRDFTPEFRRRPKEVSITDTDAGVTQRVRFPASNEAKESSRSSPLRLWDAHGCHDVRQEVIVARPIADAAKGKPRSPLSFQSPRNDGLSRVMVEMPHTLHGHTSHTYTHTNDVIKVLPIQDGGITNRGNRVVAHDSMEGRDPKKYSPRYSNHLQGENPWKQTTQKLRLSEKQHVFETSSGNPGANVNSGTTGFYSSLCCNKGSVSKR